jgi:2-oxopent-4-enoate hydratase
MVAAHLEPTMVHDPLKELADRLWTAQLSGTPTSQLTESNPDLCVEDAYMIQQINLERRIGGEGLHGRAARLVGHKVGLTSKAIQEWLGVDEPDFGGLLDDMRVENGGVASMKQLLQPRAEGELAFVLKGALSGTNLTAEDVISATDYVVPAIEIIDSRISDWKIKFIDTVSDNASSGMFVLGDERRTVQDVDMRLTGMALRKNDRVVSTGATCACLGNPVEAVVWLANRLGGLGVRLEPGHVILSGAMGPVTPVTNGDRLELSVAGLGSVRVGFE